MEITRPSRILRALLVGAAIAPLVGVARPALAGGGVVEGTVKLVGPAPAPRALTVTQDANYCGKFDLRAEDVVADEKGGLANVVVYLDGVPSEATKPRSVTLTNTHCHYVPHVVAAPVGSTLEVRNDDPILHNTHARYRHADGFNIALPRKGQVVRVQLKRPGLLRVGCDAGHTWMRAWIAVFDHPYFAVTDTHGHFRIDGVPPGTWKVVMWHEKFGRRTTTVTVTAGSTGHVEVQYAPDHP